MLALAPDKGVAMRIAVLRGGGHLGQQPGGRYHVAVSSKEAGATVAMTKRRGRSRPRGPATPFSAHQVSWCPSRNVRPTATAEPLPSLRRGRLGAGHRLGGRRTPSTSWGVRPAAAIRPDTGDTPRAASRGETGRQTGPHTASATAAAGETRAWQAPPSTACSSPVTLSTKYRCHLTASLATHGRSSQLLDSTSKLSPVHGASVNGARG